MFTRTSAIPLMPMPPTPTKCTCLMRLNMSRPFDEVCNSRFGIEDRDAPSVCFDFVETFGIADQFADRIREPFACQVGIGDQNGGVFIRHRTGVLRLVIVGRKWKWNENRRAACSLELGDGRGAGAGNDQVGGRVLFMKIVEECTDVRIEAFRRVGSFHFVQLALDGLMDKPESILPIGEAVERFHDGAVDRLRSLAAAENQDRVRNRMRLRGNGFEFGPDRISCNDGSCSEIGLRTGISDCGEVDPLAEDAIGEPRNRVLLHDDTRISAEDGGAQHGKRCITADADNDIGFELPQNASRFENAGGHTNEIAKLANDTQALDSAYRQCPQLKTFLRDDARFNPLLCSDKQDPRFRIAPLDLTGDSDAWKQMSPGSATCNDHPHVSQVRTNSTRLLRNI